jgi:hypothetical protein
MIRQLEVIDEIRKDGEMSTVLLVSSCRKPIICPKREANRSWGGLKGFDLIKRRRRASPAGPVRRQG